jgi:3-phosphoshikimate 1-carboxyvinyltransferase
MKKLSIKPHNKLQGEIEIPADKSISHRSIIISALAKGKSRIHNFLESEDCLWTLKAYKALGVDIYQNKEGLIVEGRGVHGLKPAGEKLYFGNSGTGFRLSAGVLAGCDFDSELSGDESLCRRPMSRITKPLRQMGADIDGKDNGNLPPLKIKHSKLKGISYSSPIASAQVKSSILLAGLFAEGVTSVREPYKSRDHTENMLKAYGANIEVDNLKVQIKPGNELRNQDFIIPADISSAAFFLVAALITKKSNLILKNIGLNKTRTGIIDVLKQMQANISVLNERFDNVEPLADIEVKSSILKPFIIEKEMLPRLIDEIPILMVAASQAEGVSVIKDAAELRVKETDRIESMSQGLKKMGVKLRIENNDVYIEGPNNLKGNRVDSYADHRTAMSFLVAGLLAKGETLVNDTACIDTSFPGFYDKLLSAIA